MDKLVEVNEEPLVQIPGYPIGSNITIMNAYYERPKKREDGKRDTDHVTIVFKDNETGKKHFHVITTPKFRYYLKKPEFSVGLDYNAEWADIKEVDPVVCNYNSLALDVATRLGFKDQYFANIRAGEYRLNDVYLSHPRVFSVDMNILNFVRSEFAVAYKNPVCPIDVAYYDIENDIRDCVSGKNLIGECPINMISIMYDKTHTVYSFVLRDKRNPQIQELEDSIKANFKASEKEAIGFLAKVHGEEKAKKYHLKDLKLSVGFFDDELSLIVTFFNVMKELSPDFAIAFNASYDLRYLVARLEAFGVNPQDVVCDADAPRKFYYYKVDETDFAGKFVDFKERGDYVQCASRITWLDQLILYASRRKGGAATKSYKLDDIVDQECGIHKLDWSPYASRMADFCWNNFKMFWLYNINDTIVQYCLEQQTDDIIYTFSNTLEMNTPYQKIFRQTNYLISKMTEFYKYHEGVIIGVNVNRFKKQVSKENRDKFAGAFVANPLNLTDQNKVKSHGIYIMKFNNGDDFDYKALYPSLMREFNMSNSTQIGKIIIDNPPYKGAEFLRIGNGGHFTENLASYNFIEFCHRWLYLPDVEEMIENIDWYFKNMRTPEYKHEQGNLPMDKKFKNVMVKIDNTRPMVIKRPIPQWVKDKVDEMRRGISIV